MLHSLLVDDELSGGGGCRCFAIDLDVKPGARSAPDEVNEALSSLSEKGYQFARPARTVYWKKSDNTYWIQWTIKDEVAVLWAYDPEIKEIVEVLQVRDKGHN